MTWATSAGESVWLQRDPEGCAQDMETKAFICRQAGDAKGELEAREIAQNYRLYGNSRGPVDKGSRDHF